MTVRNKTLITLTISSLLFYSCSKNDLSSKTPAIQKSDIETAKGNNSRFVSYNTIDTPQVADTRSTARDLASIPDSPVIPEGAVNMLDIDGKGTQYAAWKAVSNTNYYLPAGAVCTERLKLDGTINYYIQGELNLDFYGNGGEIYTLPEATLNLAGHLSINSVDIKSWGALKVDPASEIFIGNTASFVNYSSSDIAASRLQNQGIFEHHGNLTLTSDLDCSGKDSKLNLYGSIEASFVKIHNSATAEITGNIVAESLVEANGSATLTVGASIVLTDEDSKVYVTNNAALNIMDYIKCGTIELDSNGKIITDQETLIVCDNLIYHNNTAKIHNKDNEGVYTVVVVKNLDAAWNSIDRLSGGGMDLHTSEDEYKELPWTANVIFNGPTYIPEKGLRPEFGVRPVTPAPIYTLNHLGNIESIDKKGISATSIDFINDLAYFSWHKRGEEYDGYIDVADINNQSILSTLHSASQDFNSISVVDDLIIAAGSDTKGAIISNINYSNSAVTADYSYVDGASANSVLNVGESKWVTTNSGITILPENKFIPLESAKYSAISGDKVVVLAGTPAASLYVFEQNGELVKNFSCGTIAIENGKNTIFADGDKIYVSLGVAGLRSYDLEGNLLNEFTEVGAGAVNGVSADENFIYMACGLSGLYILDKNDFSLIKSYTLNGASANFVQKASDDLIYVAYGLNGVHIFELLVQ